MHDFEILSKITLRNPNLSDLVNWFLFEES